MTTWTPPRRTSNKADIICRPGESLVDSPPDPSSKQWWRGPLDRMAEGDLRHWRNRHTIASHLISAIVFERARELSTTFTSGASIALMHSWDAAGVLSPGQLIRIPLDNAKEPDHSIDDVAEEIAEAVDRAAEGATDFSSLRVEMSAALTIRRDDNGEFYLELNLRIAGIESNERTVTPPGIAIANIQAEYVLGKRDFSERMLRGSDLRDRNLSGSDFHLVDLRFSNLSGCDLSMCDLRDANLRGCDLSGANLRGSNLAGTNLSGCNLHNADLPD